MATTTRSGLAACLALTSTIGRTQTVEGIYSAALDALEDGLGVSRASILLFDDAGVMRFRASRGLSAAYRAAVEGHTPWTRDTTNAVSIVVPDVAREESLRPFLDAIRAEGIGAMCFIPLVNDSGVIGKFMLYYGAPHEMSRDDLQLAGVIAAQVAFAIERTRAAEKARHSEERLRFALDAASMGTWEWNLATSQVTWSANMERLHGLAAGTLDATFDSYERIIHPDDRGRVRLALRRALEGGAHDAEYRVVGVDGAIRWVEGKGRVEFQDGQPMRMTGVCVMTTRRKEAELARLASAEEANRSKDEFLATLSHELRTPLNAILGWVQILQTADLTTGRARHALDIIARNAQLQAQLIEDILDVSRIITGKLEIERAPMLVEPLLDTAIAGIQPAAEAKQIEVARDFACDLPPIEADAKRLQQVFGNVLANAVKFTPTGGRVIVRCVAEGDQVRIEIEDTGAGIAPQFLPYVFDRFLQADSGSTRRQGGLGLGLAIARHLVEQHGGAISAHSDGPGHGTRVVIRLPAMAGLPAIRRVPDDARNGLAGIRVLVVDDQRDSRELLAALFARSGAAVVQCGSAHEALTTLGTADVDLLVADIAMPDVDGYDLIGRVRQARLRLPALAVSAFARPEDRRRALAAGYDAYASKPIDPNELFRAVHDILTDLPHA